MCTECAHRSHQASAPTPPSRRRRASTDRRRCCHPGLFYVRQCRKQTVTERLHDGNDQAPRIAGAIDRHLGLLAAAAAAALVGAKVFSVARFNVVTMREIIRSDTGTVLLVTGIEAVPYLLLVEASYGLIWGWMTSRWVVPFAVSRVRSFR